MKLAVLHYHFDQGGVTQVVLNHLAGFAKANSPIQTIFLVHGGRTGELPETFDHLQATFQIQPIRVDGLDYDPQPHDQSPVLAGRIEDAITQAGGNSADTILHIHNHSLGKNASMPGAVKALASSGWPIVLQIHDFAEDYRPRNYQLLIEAFGCQTPSELERQLYPQADNIHYGVLTRRDYDLLRSIGIDANCLHWFPNSVTMGASPTDDSAGARQKVRQSLNLDDNALLGIYPVRGIRRKNLGEMLLWAAVCPQATFAVTLPPASPVERTSYEMWSRLGAKLDLNVRFDVGTIAGISFAENLAASDFMFTSSVAEGFGMVFLESQLVGKPLLGRDLPGVTDDFRAAGIEFPGLAPEIKIPASVVGDLVGPQTWEAYSSAWHWLPDGFIDALELDQENATESGEYVDFGRLPVGLQARVIAEAAQDPSIATHIRTANPIMQMATPDGCQSFQKSIAAGAARVRESFAPATLSQKIFGVYQQVLASNRAGVITPPASAGRLFGQLAGIDEFFPCRTLEL